MKRFFTTPSWMRSVPTVKSVTVSMPSVKLVEHEEIVTGPAGQDVIAAGTGKLVASAITDRACRRSRCQQILDADQLIARGIAAFRHAGCEVHLTAAVDPA